MIDGKTISLIVPCKNEAGIIADFVHRVPSYIDEIIIVDNNSTDDTASVARKAGTRVIRERRHIRGIGYGFAHQAGLTKATGDYVVAMDGDDTYPVASIRTIIEYLERFHLDIVFCNRLPLTNARAISGIRKLGIAILNTEFRILFGKRMDDLLTGMWVGRRDAVRSLDVSSGDWNYSLEIKLKAMTRPDINASEYHIRHFERKNAISKQNLFNTGLHHALYLLRYRLEHLGIIRLAYTT